MKFNRYKLIRLVTGIVFTAFVIHIFYKYWASDSFLTVISQISPVSFILPLFVYLIVTTLRALRFIVAGADMSFFNSFAVASIHAALLRIMPLRSGELAYGIMLKKLKVKSIGEGMASIVMLRILDLAVALPLTLIIAAWALENDNVLIRREIVITVAVIFIFMFFALSPVASFARKCFMGSEKRFPKIIKFIDVLNNAFCISFRKKLVLILCTSAMWFGVFFWFHTILISFNAVTSLLQGFFVAAGGVLGTILPVSLIGTFGAMEAGFAIGLNFLGHKPETIATFCLFVSIISFLCNFVVAIPFIIWFKYKKL